MDRLTVGDVLVRHPTVGLEVAVLSLDARTAALLSFLDVLEDRHWSDSDYQAPLHAWVECNVAVATSNVNLYYHIFNLLFHFIQAFLVKLTLFFEFSQSSGLVLAVGNNVDTRGDQVKNVKHDDNLIFFILP